MPNFAIAASGIAAAVRFLPAAWKGAWGALLLAAVLFAALWAVGALSPAAPWRLAALLLILAVATLAEGALYRLALGTGKPGFAGLRWGAAEWRLSAVWGLSALFLFMLGTLAFIVILAFGFAVATTGQGFVLADIPSWAKAVDARGRAVVELVGFASFAGMVWAGTRISLGSAATIEGGKIQVLSSWPRTRGLVWPIILGRCALGAVPLGIAGIALMILARAVTPSTAEVWLASGIASLAIAGLWMPLSVGLMCYLYQHPAASGSKTKVPHVHVQSPAHGL